MQTSFPKEKIRVLLLEGVHERGVTLFDEDGYAVQCEPHALSDGELAERISETHVIGIRSKTQLSSDILRDAHKLLAIGCFCIGTNQVDLRTASLKGVPVFNAPFSNTRSVAELTIAEIVALSRRLIDRAMDMHEGRWKKSAIGAHEVRGLTLGIVGYGRIGSQVSVLAEAMGMRVVYHDIRPCLPLGNARPVGSLDELLATSDFVSLHLPATNQTFRLIAEDQIAKMKPGAHLINNARGTVVDIDALADALESGHLAGAAIDVFPTEPASKEDVFDTRLARQRNVIMTPHIGGSTMEAQQAIADDVSNKLLRFLNNGSTTGAVNVPEVDLPEQTSRDGAPRRHRLLHFHRNVPGVLSNMHTAIADVGANIAAEYLQTSGEIGYVVLDVDPSDGQAILDRLRKIPETLKVRALW